MSSVSIVFESSIRNTEIPFFDIIKLHQLARYINDILARATSITAADATAPPSQSPSFYFSLPSSLSLCILRQVRGPENDELVVAHVAAPQCTPNSIPRPSRRRQTRHSTSEKAANFLIQFAKLYVVISHETAGISPLLPVATRPRIIPC